MDPVRLFSVASLAVETVGGCVVTAGNQTINRAHRKKGDTGRHIVHACMCVCVCVCVYVRVFVTQSYRSSRFLSEAKMETSPVNSLAERSLRQKH